MNKLKSQKNNIFTQYSSHYNDIDNITKYLLNYEEEDPTSSESDINLLKSLIKYSNMSQKEFANSFGIPQKTLEGWLSNNSNKKPKKYVINMIRHIFELEIGTGLNKKIQNVLTIEELITKFKDINDKNIFDLIIDWGFTTDANCAYPYAKTAYLDTPVIIVYKWKSLQIKEFIDNSEHIDEFINSHDYEAFIELAETYGEKHFPRYATAINLGSDEKSPNIRIYDIYNKDVFKLISSSECCDIE